MAFGREKKNVPDPILDDEALAELAQIWQSKHPGQHLPRDQLLELASRTLRAMQLVYRPIPRDQAQKIRRLMPPYPSNF